MLTKAAEELLDRIEAIECRSLSWGYADGSLSRDEVLHLIPDITVEAAVDCVEELVAASLIFERDNEEGESRYRSRFAETMRLLSRLRQLFPGRPWIGAPRLVSDFRVDLRRRRYPRRNRPGRKILADNEAMINTSPLRRSLWEALVEGPQLVLAEFQERATLRLLPCEADTATIVTAGTGSGKTLSFYLPALIRIGELIKLNQFWVKALAIYPRIELLKDQLSEAFSRARQMDDVMASTGKRKVLVGALFGSTPTRADQQSLQRAKWIRRNGAYICPWIKCPSCNADLIWRESDVVGKEEKLVCVDTQCDYVINHEAMVLTRERLIKQPPDILFTTTEMLNQRMSDLSMRRIFGVGVPQAQRPILALLDEVHTYVGTTGAQSSLVLRRWRHLMGAPVTWCGLSATLQDAERFFSDLTGIPKDRVAEITPAYDELIEEGAQYQVILRADPTLQASVLSTSIQTAMLVARMLDPQGSDVSLGNFGQRLFVFTDDLDVTNRLFDSLRDAEAYTIFGRADFQRTPLAALRARFQNDVDRRDAEGQRWWAIERIGRDLNDRLRVGRTTSQDTGVLANADVVVATASLEVGYNDEQVGAVVQHKAPRNMASFLQRKGRAGRKRGMRPLTVTVLSEYGRDRIAFQAYEHLFDPVVPAQYLPVHNQYVLRIQAVFSLFDWLASEAAHLHQRGWIWDALSQPDNSSERILPLIRQRLTDLLRGEAGTVGALSNHLQRSLGLSQETVNSILWDPPRSLLLEVIPTLTRRLIRKWELAVPLGNVFHDLYKSWHPLPDFVPKNLFSDLSLPEVQVLLPPATVNDDEKYDALPIIQALQQLAPGRVTRRFAHERGALSHWFPIDISAEEQIIQINEYARLNEAIGTFSGNADDGASLTLPVYRPWEIRLERLQNRDVLPTSNSFAKWFSYFEAQGTPLVIPVPPRSAWFDVVSEICFHLHQFRGSVLVRRFSPEAEANLRLRTGDRRVRVSYVDPDGASVAVGFEAEVDGFYVDFKLPDFNQLADYVLPDDLAASSRLAYLRYRLLSDKEMPADVNSLQREWLFQILVSSALPKAEMDCTSVHQAARSILEDRPEEKFAEVLRSLFSVQDVEEDSIADGANEPEEAEDKLSSSRANSRLEERLLDTIGRPDVISRLLVLLSELEAPTASELGAWVFRTLHETLAEALLQACINVAPRHAATDGLLADLVVKENGLARVWITETTLGGAGVIQAFASAFAEEPRRLFRAIEAVLAPTDLELASLGLKQFLLLLCSNEAIADLTNRLRTTQSHEKREVLQKSLHEAVLRHGVTVGHALGVSLNARILRPGLSPEWDKLLRDLLTSWEKLEAKHKLSIGLREFSYVAINLPGFRERLRKLTGASLPVGSDTEFIQVLGSILWPRGLEIRQRALQSYNPFRIRKATDPALVRHILLGRNVPSVSINGDGDWKPQFVSLISEFSTVQLNCNLESGSQLRAAIVEALATPIDVGYLQFFPVVERFERTEAELRVTLSLREHV